MPVTQRRGDSGQADSRNIMEKFKNQLQKASKPGKAKFL
jgi:hypothetical protein